MPLLRSAILHLALHGRLRCGVLALPVQQRLCLLVVLNNGAAVAAPGDEAVCTRATLDGGLLADLAALDALKDAAAEAGELCEAVEEEALLTGAVVSRVAGRERERDRAIERKGEGEEDEKRAYGRVAGGVAFHAGVILVVDAVVNAAIGDAGTAASEAAWSHGQLSVAVERSIGDGASLHAPPALKQPKRPCSQS